MTPLLQNTIEKEASEAFAELALCEKPSNEILSNFSLAIIEAMKKEAERLFREEEAWFGDDQDHAVGGYITKKRCLAILSKLN